MKPRRFTQRRKAKSTPPDLDRSLETRRSERRIRALLDLAEQFRRQGLGRQEAAARAYAAAVGQDLPRRSLQRQARPA